MMNMKACKLWSVSGSWVVSEQVPLGEASAKSQLETLCFLNEWKKAKHVSKLCSFLVKIMG